MTYSNNSFKQKIAILSLSLIIGTTYAISPALPGLSIEMKGVSLLALESITTLPAISAIIMMYFSEKLVKLFSSKTVVLVALIGVALIGALPLFLDHFLSIVVSRLLLGLALGILNSLSVSLIGQYFTGTSRANLMGIRSAIESLGSALATFISGRLLLISSQFSFLVYLIAIPILIIFSLFFENKSDEKNTIYNNKSVESSNHISKKILLVAFLCLFIVMGSVGVNIQLASIVMEENLGTMTDASNILSLMTILGMVGGFSFGKLFTLLQTRVFSIFFLIYALGMFFLATSTNIKAITIAAIIIGASYSIIMAYLFHRISDFAIPGSEVFSSSIVLVGCNIGGLLAPYILSDIRTRLNMPSVQSSFYVLGVLYLVILTIQVWKKIV